MRFLAIDLRTTGLIPTEHQILQIEVVIGDFRTPKVEELPRWQAIIARQRIEGHPHSLHLNRELIAKIAYPREYPSELFFNSPDGAYYALWSWLGEHEWPLAGPSGEAVGVVAAVGEEIQFLRSNGESWDRWFRFKRRSLDPCGLYLQHGDCDPPSLERALERAGVAGEVGAAGIVWLLRNHYGMEPPELLFRCDRCGEQASCAPEPPRVAFCERCCPGHEFVYDSDRRGDFCDRCDGEAPPDYHSDG